MEIEVENLSFHHKKNQILHNVCMHISSSMVTTIVGSSGSGKSTLLYLFSKGNPTKGTIKIGNIDISDKNKIPTLKKQIGYLPTHFETVFMRKTVGEQLLFWLNFYSYEGNLCLQIHNTLSLVGLDDSFFTKKIEDLTYNNQRKVALASILVYDPSILLLDEPMQGLHPIDVQFLEKQLFFLKKQKTIIVATKDTELALRISDYVYVINQGVLMEQGDKISVLKKEEILKLCHLEVPKTIQFSNLVFQRKSIKLGYRSEVNDLIKDIYRNISCNPF